MSSAGAFAASAAAGAVSKGSPLPQNVNVLDHPVLRHEVTQLRCEDTTSPAFRTLLGTLTFNIGFDIADNGLLKVGQKLAKC